MNQLSDDSTELSPDQVYEILGHAYRRRVLCTLHERPGSVDVEELATIVAAHSRDEPVAEVSADDRDAVLVELHHNHLPRLRSVGLVAYDPAHGSSVELSGDIQPLLPTLETGDENLRQYRVD